MIPVLSYNGALQMVFGPVSHIVGVGGVHPLHQSQVLAVWRYQCKGPVLLYDIALQRVFLLGSGEL